MDGVAGMHADQRAAAPRASPATAAGAGYLALAIAFAIGCGLLSWWQFARRTETAEANALVVANYDAAPRPLGDVLRGLGAYSAEPAVADGAGRPAST